MPRRSCPICRGMEPETVDRLLLVGHGVRFVSARWGHTRRGVKAHRARCLVGDRRKRVEADLIRMAAKPGGGGRG
jgi:hypothetical protein